jgi:hypothetical protein
MSQQNKYKLNAAMQQSTTTADCFNSDQVNHEIFDASDSTDNKNIDAAGFLIARLQMINVVATNKHTTKAAPIAPVMSATK